MTKKKATTKAEAAKVEEQEKDPKTTTVDTKDQKETTEKKEEVVDPKKEDAKTELKEDSKKGLTFEEAENLMSTGESIALPEWGGFWTKDIKSGETIVVTKEGEVLNTPEDKYKERNDWVVVKPTKEQSDLLKSYLDSKNDSNNADENESQKEKKEAQEKLEKDSKKVDSDTKKLKAVYYSRAHGTSWIELNKPISYKDLVDRKKLPVDATINSTYLLDNGSAFSALENRITNQDLSKELETLKKAK